MSRRSDHVVATRPRPSKWTRPFSSTSDASVTLWIADDLRNPDDLRNTDDLGNTDDAEPAAGAVVMLAAVLDTSRRQHRKELNRLATYFEGFGLRFNS